MTNTDRVKQYVKEMGQATAPICAAALGLKTRQAYRCMEELYQRGWLQKKGRGVFVFNGCVQDSRRTSELQQKIWRAMGLSRSFTSFEIATLSGATLNHVRHYLAPLISAGLAEKVGKKGRYGLYRLAADAPRRAPQIMRERSQKRSNEHELIDLAWAMIRALQAGRRAEARRIHGEIGKKLQIYRGKNGNHTETKQAATGGD